MTLPFGLDRTFSVSSPRNTNRRAARIAMHFVCFAVLAVACRTARSAPPLTAHAGGTVSIGSGFGVPQGVAVDKSGNVFVADSGAGVVYEIVAVDGVVSSSSMVNTIGSGFNTPADVAVDGSGNVFVADQGNNAVYEIVAVNGVVSSSSTVIPIGSGFSYPASVAVDGSGNVFVANLGTSQIKQIVAVGGVVSSSSTVNTIGSGFSSPTGVAVDGNGNVFVADQNNHAVKEILAAGGYTTVNTIGSGFTYPTSVAVDGSGNVFVTDLNKTAAYEIVAVGGVVSSSSTVNTIGSGFNQPSGVAVDGGGNVFVADFFNSAVKEIVRAAQKLPTTAVGSTSVSLSVPFTFDGSGSIGAPVVLMQGATGLDFADVGTGTCTTNGTSHTYSAGDICTVDVTFTPKYPGQRLGAVQLMNTGGAVIATANIYGTGTGPLVAFNPGTASVIDTGGVITQNPYQLALDGAGNMYVGNYTGKNVTKIAAGGGTASVLSLGTPGGTALQNVTGVAIDGAGNLFIGDHLNSRILVMTPAGVVSVLSISGLSPALGLPTALDFDGAGNLYIADYTNGRIVKVSSLLIAGSTSSGTGTVIRTGGYSFSGSTLTGLTVDSQGTIYAAARTQNNNSIVKVTATGIASLVNTGGLTLNSPQGVFADGMGNLYIADTSNNRIVKVTAAGITTVVSIAGLTNPSTLGALTFGVTADPAGNLYIADWSNNRIVEVNTATASALTFPATSIGATNGPQTVTVSNLGNADLSFLVPVTGLNPSISTGFTLGNSSTCPQLNASSSVATLAQGTSCTMLVSFSPTTTGSNSGSLVLTDDNLNTTPSTTQTISLNGTGLLITPTLAFATIPAHVYGDTPFIVTATSLSSGAVTYTVTSGPATISGSTVTITGVGTVNLSASQAATADYASATATTSFAVGQATPTLTFATIPAHIYGDAPFSVSATSASSGVVTYTVTSGPATISGSTVTLTGAGTVVLSASQAATATYAAATATASFVVSLPTPTLAFAPIPAHIFGDAPFSVSATSASSGAVTYTVTSGPATISGSTVTLTGAGTVVLSASQAATATYGAATATTSFTVGQAIPADFSLASTAGTSTQSIAAGGTATFSFSLAPVGGAYPGTVSFTATGLPAGATATFSPASIAANGGAQTVTLTVKTSAVAKLDMPLFHRGGLIAFALLFLPLAGTRRMRRVAQTLARKTSLALLLLLSLGAVAGLSGCGSDSSPIAPTPKSYTIAVTASSATTQHTTNFTLQVQ